MVFAYILKRNEYVKKVVFFIFLCVEYTYLKKKSYFKFLIKCF